MTRSPNGFVRLTCCVALLAALGGCGGTSTSGTTLGPPDAVLWAEATSGPVELRGVYQGHTGTIPFGFANGSYVVSPDRRHVFLRNDDGSSIVDVDGTEHPLEQTYWLAWSPDGKRLAMVNDGSPVVADDDGTNPVGVPFDAQAPTTAITWSPNGATVAFGIDQTLVLSPADGTTAIVASTGPPTAPESDVRWTLQPSFSPDGSTLAVVSSEGTLTFVDAEGTVTASVLGATTPTFGWSADGAWLAVRTANGACVVANPDGRTLVVLPANCVSAAWSPVDVRLAVNDFGGMGLGTLGVWSPGDDAPVALADNPVESTHAWSPDGSILSFVSRDGGVVLIDASDGTEIARATARELAWNSTGSRLFFVSDQDEVVTADGRGASQLSIAGDARGVTWLPDGEHLAVAASREVFTVGANGEGRVMVSEIPAGIAAVGWAEPQSP